MNTPWGESQVQTEIAPGIVFHSTASHGGVKLDRTRNAKVPVFMRRTGGWYEEDVDWSIPAVVFPVEFAKQIETARTTLVNWLPDEFAAFYSVDVPVESSYILQKRRFETEHANSLVVTAAWGDWHDKVPSGKVGVVASIGGRRLRGAVERWFIVPESEYDNRDHFGFVIDESRHQPWPDHA